jgi:nitrite reductase (NADH) small subunit
MMATAELTLVHRSAIPPGEGRAFDVHGQRIAVFLTRAGDVYAVQAECPHKGGPLADGLVGGVAVICPLHQRKFDLATGASLSGDCPPLRTYPARLDETGHIVLTVQAL